MNITCPIKTPRTDAAEIIISNTGPDGSLRVVMSDFARILEREGFVANVIVDEMLKIGRKLEETLVLLANKQPEINGMVNDCQDILKEISRFNKIPVLTVAEFIEGARALPHR